MSESDLSALFYLLRQAKNEVTKMSMTANQVIVDHHFRCAHDALDEAIRLLGTD